MATNIEEIRKRKEDSKRYIQELRNTIKVNGESHHLISHYPYWRELNFSHEENLALIKRELNNQKKK